MKIDWNAVRNAIASGGLSLLIEESAPKPPAPGPPSRRSQILEAIASGGLSLLFERKNPNAKGREDREL